MATRRNRQVDRLFKLFALRIGTPNVHGRGVHGEIYSYNSKAGLIGYINQCTSLNVKVPIRAIIDKFI